MFKFNTISSKIKILGALLVALMLSVIVTTIYLNQQNAKDALLINIAGKQRMLTQKISKNIFYIHYSSNKDFYELNAAVDEFISGLNTLKHGEQNRGIASAPTPKIAEQITQVSLLWNDFHEDIQNFKLHLNSNDADKDAQLNNIVTSIYKNNTILLDNVDKLVTMYTLYSESKTEYIKTFQYISAFALLLIFIYALIQLRLIESHVDQFMEYSKRLINEESGKKIQPLNINAESEILEVSDTINCFIKKINSAMDYSNEALLQSQNAALKLEEITDEFDTILDELKDKSLSSKYLNNSEDMAIASAEGLIKSTKKLQTLKEELEKLTISCQTSSI
jgi:nitrate/nitrite-specific signal transduction histidine kinase